MTKFPLCLQSTRNCTAAVPEHFGYLHAQSSDPRPALAERLIAALGDVGSICVYSGLEGRSSGVLPAICRSLPNP